MSKISIETEKTKFVLKQLKLERALTVVKVKLVCFAETADREFHQVYETLTPEEVHEKRAMFDSWNWNNWHDLQYRLEDRLRDNWSAYHDWHWNKFGFNAYN